MYTNNPINIVGAFVIDMLRRLSALATTVLIVVMTSGCASQHTVVLVPSPDGHTGKAEVITASGRVLLDKAFDMTRVSGPSAPPEPVTTALPEYISATFGDALMIAPPPSATFTLYFETGTTILTVESQAIIANMLEIMRQRKPLTIAVSGHTDAAGTTQINDRLSYERADMVKELLLHNGVDAKRVTVSSHGKANPAISTPDGVAEPRNRRVDVVIR